MSMRTGHAAVNLNEKIYIFGGTDEIYSQNDLFEVDIKNLI